MSVDKFRFVSPGVFIKEIDQSFLPATAENIGPLIIGRTRFGPGLRPILVESQSDFINTFGVPASGKGSSNDIWREGNMTAPTYASYAAMAYLANNGPVTMIRLLGKAHGSATTAGAAGWKIGSSDTSTAPAYNKGAAYGLYVFDGIGHHTAIGTGNQHLSGTLAAVWYCEDNFSLALRGTNRAGNPVTEGSGAFALLKNSGPSYGFKMDVYDSSTLVETIGFNFDRNSQQFIRNVFNTNPTKLNENRVSTAKKYILGESFEGHLMHGGGMASGSEGTKRPIGHYYRPLRPHWFRLSGSGGGGEATAGYSLSASKGATPANTVLGCIVPLINATAGHNDRNLSTQEAATGWFISQDIRGSGSQSQNKDFNPGENKFAQKLFKLHGLNGGEWIHKNLKISIQNIRASQNNIDPYGTFTVLLRKIDDNDANVQEVERFDQCNLNPASPKYIARVIGDQKLVWDETNRRYVQHGNYPNRSRFIRVQMNDDVDQNLADSKMLPFGVFGPTRYKPFSMVSGSGPLVQQTPPVRICSSADTGAAATYAMWFSGSSTVASHSTGSLPPGAGLDAQGPRLFTGGISKFSASVSFPEVPLRLRSDQHTKITDIDSMYWGANTCVFGQSLEYDQSVPDVLIPLANGVDSRDSSTNLEYSWIFTLDDIYYDPDDGAWIYRSGSRADGLSFSCVSGSTSGSATSTSPSTGQGYLLAQGIDKFTTVFQGGFDGLEIQEKEPFNHQVIGTAGLTEKTNYAYNSVSMAIDMANDTETLDFNLATIPGVRSSALTGKLITTCENRGDALAVIDLDGDYDPDTEGVTGFKSEEDRIGNVDTAIRRLRDRSLNSSYGCAYYPWVQIQDNFQQDKGKSPVLWVPPSVVALGAMGRTETVKQVWFAPAGFNQGGLTQNHSGLPVLAARQKLTPKERDKLYDANINPIAEFPNEGVVIFGQKTLQVTPSALDRINVRRLMIYVKKQISSMANNLLFEQNVEETWNRFLNVVNPFLQEIKSGLGLTDFKVVLDSTTTTPELVDRNIMYAKIFLKPARSIEFIAIDFTITNTGASFED